MGLAESPGNLFSRACLGARSDTKEPSTLPPQGSAQDCSVIAEVKATAAQVLRQTSLPKRNIFNALTRFQSQVYKIIRFSEQGNVLFDSLGL